MLFLMEEALRTLEPEDPGGVGCVALILHGNVSKWLISSRGPDASRRPTSWREFRVALREAFAERHSDELNCVRLFCTKQDGSLEE